MPCLFTTGKAPSFPMPDLALGCLVKPFSHDDLVRALTMAEDVIRGRQGLQLKPNRPENLRVYAEEQARVRIETTELLPTPGPEPGPPPAARPGRAGLAQAERRPA